MYSIYRVIHNSSTPKRSELDFNIVYNAYYLYNSYICRQKELTSLLRLKGEESTVFVREWRILAAERSFAEEGLKEEKN
ncbi:hypothetical protein A3D00_03100 [Candidatus Woesebacteria bacterium RIFCSPHIGHO2_02_FULL_38_9]|uniref:Uncharacterized protein n=1 Tax=Candidatus Woesebacteria bacterium RIFCSPHIGHO2_01_FULL_39_28 TaxID=1802496 RepID=A0A1F7YLF5_9BACT|nr:MAG: hypothetical protein A2627_00565 [Candidatus Woesebacteria bacterium RIFCSPHIGHO2_01_FULL_39_28]OGM33032.1 MAG: hypothetical protein A3D00_03100 [Candidatus Woesebacteria bacterium RIFCSPHIGHO2_02_FULL_38_9]